MANVWWVWEWGAGLQWNAAGLNVRLLLLRDNTHRVIPPRSVPSTSLTSFCYCHHLRYLFIPSVMNTLPGNSQERNFSPTRHSYALLNTQTGNNSTNNVGSLNINVGNVSHSYNNTFYLGPDEDTLPIQAWLSPLEPHKRHQDVRNLRLDGIGDWILRTSGFESWCEGRSGSEHPVLLGYGRQGVGKTYIKY